MAHVSVTHIPFNKPHLTGEEETYIQEALKSGHFSGNGPFTKKCHAFFEQRFGFKKCLLTTSCTDALEMSALLVDIQPGDEVIIPAYTFVSTANAFGLRGAKMVFADSYLHHPNIDPAQLEALITPRTKAIVVVHYAGMACDMDVIMEIAERHGVFVIEDAAQAIDATYKGRPLGSIGHLAAFSFHATKNITCGEGGLLIINDKKFIKRSEIIWEKGTNRAAFSRGEVSTYHWVDLGSSFLPSDLTAAFLWAQLQEMKEIRLRRLAIWNRYYQGLSAWAETHGIGLPQVPDYATHNARMFYLVCKSQHQREALVAHLSASGIQAYFHYLSLHQSPYFLEKHDGRSLPHADAFTDRLVRLPLFVDLEEEAQAFVIERLEAF